MRIFLQEEKLCEAGVWSVSQHLLTNVKGLPVFHSLYIIVLCRVLGELVSVFKGYGQIQGYRMNEICQGCIFM